MKSTNRNLRTTHIWRFVQCVFSTVIVFANFAPAVSAADSRQLTLEEKKTVVETACEKIETIYPFKEIGSKTFEGLRQQFEAGDLDEITDAKLFAGAVTEIMEELSRDKHLDLYFDPVRAKELIKAEDAGDADSGPGAEDLELAKWENYGFKTLRMLDGRVGYLDLRMFFGAEFAGPVAVTAMDFLSRSNAVIIDLRYNGGGWDDMVTLLAGYFTENKESETVAISRSTLDQSYFASTIPSFVPGRKMTNIPVYLLVSSSTASAAEAFASILRHFNPQVLLVGQTTAGAENPVGFVALNEEFVLKIPCYEKIFFGSRPPWEGKGLAPDLESPVHLALETAHQHALEKLYELHTEASARKILQWGIDGYKARLEPAAVAQGTLESYAGSYGSTKVLLEGGDLILQYKERSQRRLLPIAADYFIVEGRDDMRLRFVSEGGQVTAMERIYSDGWRGMTGRD